MVVQEVYFRNLMMER